MEKNPNFWKHRERKIEFFFEKLEKDKEKESEISNSNKSFSKKNVRTLPSYINEKDTNNIMDKNQLHKLNKKELEKTEKLNVNLNQKKPPKLVFVADSKLDFDDDPTQSADDLDISLNSNQSESDENFFTNSILKDSSSSNFDIEFKETCPITDGQFCSVELLEPLQIQDLEMEIEKKDSEIKNLEIDGKHDENNEIKVGTDEINDIQVKEDENNEIKVGTDETNNLHVRKDEKVETDESKEKELEELERQEHERQEKRKKRK